MCQVCLCCGQVNTPNNFSDISICNWILFCKGTCKLKVTTAAATAKTVAVKRKSRSSEETKHRKTPRPAIFKKVFSITHSVTGWFSNLFSFPDTADRNNRKCQYERIRRQYPLQLLRRIPDPPSFPLYSSMFEPQSSSQYPQWRQSYKCNGVM